jgi:hypothetical protein
MEGNDRARAAPDLRRRHRRLRRLGGTLEYSGETRLTAPVSQRPCAAWWIRIEEHRRSGKNSRWVTLAAEQDAQSFLVRDGSGTALVNMTGLPQIAIVKDVHLSSGMFDAPTPHLLSLLEERGHSPRTWLGFAKSIRFEEGIPPREGRLLISDDPETIG